MWYLIINLNKIVDGTKWILGYFIQRSCIYLEYEGSVADNTDIPCRFLKSVPCAKSG
jgi:hypothetical protein